MYKSIFQKAGLTPTQALILEYLYANKEAKASVIAQKINKSRAIVYKDLDEMTTLQIIERIEGAQQVSVFRIGHPSQMEKFFDKKEKQIKKDRQLFDNYLPDLVSSYNLLSNKPGVKYYEGIDGIIRALENIASRLKPETEIISFAKVLPNEYLDELNNALDKFVKKRICKKVKTRVITLDESEGKTLQEHDNSNLRITKIALNQSLPLDFPGGEIYIYDNEINCLAVENDAFFAFTIESKSITQLLRAFFEAEWSLL